MLNVCFGYGESEILSKATGEEFTYSHRHLDLGRIHLDDFENLRREWLIDFYSVGLIAEREKVWQADCKRFNDIIERAKTEKVIRVWCASSPCSKCGFFQLIYSLRGVQCTIFVVEMPKDAGRGPLYDRAWAEANTEQIFRALKEERALSDSEREEFALSWQRLAQENALLRLNDGETVKSFPEDYLDGEIFSYAPKNKRFTLGSLVATTLDKCVHAVGDSFVAKRIENMIERGLFIVTGERPKKRYDYYSKTMLKVSEYAGLSLDATAPTENKI